MASSRWAAGCDTGDGPAALDDRARASAIAFWPTASRRARTHAADAPFISAAAAILAPAHGPARPLGAAARPAQPRASEAARAARRAAAAAPRIASARRAPPQASRSSTPRPFPRRGQKLRPPPARRARGARRRPPDLGSAAQCSVALRGARTVPAHRRRAAARQQPPPRPCGSPLPPSPTHDLRNASTCSITYAHGRLHPHFLIESKDPRKRGRAQAPDLESKGFVQRLVGSKCRMRCGFGRFGFVLVRRVERTI